MDMGTTTVLAAPHLFEPTDVDPWIIQLALSIFYVYMFDMWADRIPGVQRLSNRVPQILTLIMIATAVSTLQDTKFVGSLSEKLADLADDIGAALSATWNIAGIAVTVVVGIWLALRYMKSEKIRWDGIFFGLAMTVAATLVPWVGDFLEIIRYSLLTGVINVVVTVLEWIGKLTIS